MKFQEMKSFIQFLSQTEGSNTPAWQNAIGNLQALIEAMEPYETEDGKGNYPPISQEEYRRIETIFDDAVTSTNAFIKENSNDIHDDIRIQLSKNLNKEFLSKAYLEFKNVKPNPAKSLHDCMEDFRYENVELSSDELSRVGGNMSSRIQMTIDLDGQKTKGVFTKSTFYDPNAQYASLLDEMKLKYGAFNSFWDAMDDVEFMRGGFQSFTTNLLMNIQEGVVYDVNPETKQEALNNLPLVVRMGDHPEIEAAYEQYKNDPDFYNALLDFSVKAEQLSTQIAVNETYLGLKTGQGIDNRNSAMSSVANLIGVSDLIAKSKALTVKMPDGTFQTGTFMEFVDSKDITNLDPIDEMRVYGLDAYEGKEVKTQLANLQVLDYICGNVDRHLGNILYRFDPQTHKLASIKGIDNDASFLKKDLGKRDGLSQLPGIRKMRVIDQTMAEKLLTIDEGMLGATLHGYGLTEAEINAAWGRLHNLQEAIKEAPTYDPKKGLEPFSNDGDSYGLTIVKSEDWDKLSLENLKVGNNYFGKIIDAQEAITTQNLVSSQMKQTAECSKRSVKAMLKKENTKGLLQKAKSHKPFMGTSRRYLNVLSALKNYQNIPVPEDPLSEAAQAKWEAVTELKRAVEAYNQEKKDIGHFDAKGRPAQNFTGKALHRIEDVAEIGKFADKLLEAKKLATDSKKAIETATKKQEQLDEFKSKSPQEQQVILDQKHAQEQEMKQDLSVRLEQSLSEDDSFHLLNESASEDLSIASAEPDLHQGS